MTADDEDVQERLAFDLAFDPTLIEPLAARYSYRKDEDALEAGERILSGERTKNNLLRIFDWKIEKRGRSRILRNSDADISDALELSIRASTDRAAVAVLLGLHGVQLPVASAVLTAVFPNRFTIIDWRALEALGVSTKYLSVQFYLDYLNKCRELAGQYDVSLRTLDRALWQWSKEQARTS